MGRKKGFFDKRNSVTYSLIHTSAPAGQQSERLWVEKSRGITVGSPDPAGAGQVQSDSVGGLPPGHPLAWLSEGPETALTDAQRRETVDLGLPDDGYDYLQHLRDPRLSYAASAENQAEPSVVQGAGDCAHHLNEEASCMRRKRARNSIHWHRFGGIRSSLQAELARGRCEGVSVVQAAA